MGLIEKKDAQLDKLADQVGIILVPCQQETISMIKRHNLLSKKNSKKTELEKTSTMIKNQLEISLKTSNRKS